MDAWKLCFLLLPFVALCQAVDQNATITMAVAEIAEHSQAAITKMLSGLKKETVKVQQDLRAQLEELRKVNLMDFQTDEEYLNYLQNATLTLRRYKSSISAQNKWDQRLQNIAKYIDEWLEKPFLRKDQKDALKRHKPIVLNALKSGDTNEKLKALADVQEYLETNLLEVISEASSTLTVPPVTDPSTDTSTFLNISSLIEQYKELKNLTASISEIHETNKEIVAQGATNPIPKLENPTQLVQWEGELKDLTEAISQLSKEISK